MRIGDTDRLGHLIERVLAIVVLVALAPVVVAVSLLIMVIDRRRPFVKLERIGQELVPFGLIKFQTMAPAGLGGRITGAADVRVSRLGGVIRSLRIDEIPQLLNIVRGQMALVGPRPESPAFVDADDSVWQQVCSVRPGIGGTTQLFASRWESMLLQGDDVEKTYQEVLLPAKLDLDAWYVANRSWRLDIKVMWATLSELFLRREASALRRRVLNDIDSAQVTAVQNAVLDIEAHGGAIS